jgi:hypothetical protein
MCFTFSWNKKNVIIPEPVLHNETSGKTKQIQSFSAKSNLSSKSHNLSRLSSGSSKILWSLFDHPSIDEENNYDVDFHENYDDLVPPLSMHSWRNISHLHHSSKKRNLKEEVVKECDTTSRTSHI